MAHHVNDVTLEPGNYTNPWDATRSRILAIVGGSGLQSIGVRQRADMTPIASPDRQKRSKLLGVM